MKKLIAIGLSVACLTFGAFSFAACGGTSHTHTYDTTKWEYNDTHHYYATTCGHTVAPKDSDGYAAHNIQNGECTVCHYVAPVDLDEFVAQNLTAMQQFVQYNIRPTVVESREIKAESWTVKGDDNDSGVTQVTITYIYTDGEANRKLEIASVAFPTVVKYADIKSGASITIQSSDITRQTAFEFDARTNYNNQNISAALFAEAEIETSELYPNTLYNEVQSDNNNYRAFELLAQSNNKITIKSIRVEKGNGTDNDLIMNIDGPRTKIETKSEYTINGSNIYNVAYTLEDLGEESEKGEEGPDDPENPDNPDDPEQPSEPVTNAEVIAALEEYCKTNLVNRCFVGITVNHSNVSNGIWYVSKDTNGKITSAEYLFKYNLDSTCTYIKIGKVIFSYPISLNELKDGNIGSVSYSSVYSFNYDPTIQQTRAELTNAICDKVFGVNENAVRYIVDVGNITDSTLNSDAHAFTILEIIGNSVKEITINIKRASNDSEYISKLSNSSNYRTYDEKSYTISGTKVENNDLPFAAE